MSLETPNQTVEKLRRVLFDLQKYIRAHGGKWTIYSEAGKPMGTYDSKEGATRRLGQIEYFRHQKSMDDLRNLAATLSKNEMQRVIDAAMSSPPIRDPKNLTAQAEPQSNNNPHNNMPEFEVSPIITGLRGGKLQAQRFSGQTQTEVGSTGGGIGPNVGAHRT